MRLKKAEIELIKETVHQLDPDAGIRLFGSRIDKNSRGGDIDLLIISKKLDLKEKLIIRYKLKEKIGDQKIDIVITPEPADAFTRYIMNHSLVL
jgi:predicted nucleotidyltransferase